MNKKKQGIKIRLTLPHFKRPQFAIYTILLYIKQRIADLTYPIRSMWKWTNRRMRFSVLFIAGAVVVSHIAVALDPFLVQQSYALGKSEPLLGEKDSSLASLLKFDQKQQMFTFDTQGQRSENNVMGGGGSISVSAYADATKGVTVTDSTNKSNFTMTPKFKTAPGQKDSNRIVYPLLSHDGWLVYTMTGAGPKEDILLNSSSKGDLTFEYEMNLENGLEARMESNGSVGIYGNKLFSGQVTTGTEKDAELLEKARKNAAKDTRLFTIPAPIIKETGKDSGNVQANFEIDGNLLRVHVRGLKGGNYPLTIDPSIYVVTAYQFMYGNNETNIDFDVDNKLIKKGQTTGARFDSWQNTANLPLGSWGSGSVASGGYIYQVGGSSFAGQVYSTPGQSNFAVPSGVTSITVTMWGGGSGGGGGGTAAGGAGAGGGSLIATIPVTPAENLTVYVAAGGSGGASHGAIGSAGGGGGASTLYRGATPLAIAGGGGGGGGALNSGAKPGGAGGPGGCTSSGTSCTGSPAGTSGGGGGGTTSAGGAGGTGGGCTGGSGASINGGDGAATALFFGCTTGGGGGGGAGGAQGGGTGGSALSFFNNWSGAGGGGGGYFGGGGGGSGGTNGTAGGGGGGGANYTIGTATGVTHYIGSGATPGDSSNPYRGIAGNGGTGGTGNGVNGTSGSAGKIVISTNAAGNPATPYVNWAKFDTGDGTVVNADPGNGQCSGWCTTSAYDMPGPRSNFSLVAYNGYLYAMGGNDEFGANPCCGAPAAGHKYTNVWIAKLGANGEPRLWSPDSDDPSTWDYWYESTGSSLLPDERINGAAVAYNNKMYFIGGLDDTVVTSSYPGAPQSTVWVANILPNGKLGAWSTSTALTSGGPGALYGMTGLVYNDKLYITGGATTFGGSPLATVYYIKINSDGSLASSWQQSSSFTTGRINSGGNNAVVWGGYLYIAGGCSAMNASGICTNVLGDTQIASINADGTLGTFTTISGVTNTRTGFGMLAWRDNIYVVGGCSAQDAISGDCLSGIQAGIDYGAIEPDGEVSTVTTSVTSGTAPCSGTNPTNCNYNITTNLASIFIHNGFLYVLGGCTNNACTTTSRQVAYTGIAPNGDLSRPTTCGTGFANSNGWCTLTTALTAGRAGMAITVFNNTIYGVGGFTGSGLSDVIERATINADGSLTGLGTQTLTGLGATSVSYTYSFTRAHPSTALAGNLYIVGGCTTSGSGPSCAAFTQNVYKCDIAAGATAISSCSTTSQLQIGTPTGASGTGLALAAGAINGDYIYLAGGQAPGLTETNRVRYAKIDSSNNIVTAGSGWVETQSLANSTRWAAAFAHNGYLYVTGGFNVATGLQNTIRSIKINMNDGSLDTGGWRISAVTITARWGLAATASNGQAYMIGGCTTGNAPGSCTVRSATVQKVKLYNNESGSPASWSTSNVTNFTGRYNHGTAVLNGKIYVAGGCSGSGFFNDCGGTYDTVLYSTINNDGSLSNWATTSANLPTQRGGIKLFAVGGTLYIVGGNSAGLGTYYSSIYYGTPAGSGDVTSWGTASNSLPETRSYYGGAVWNNRIYIIGGVGSNCVSLGIVCNTIYYSPDLSAGGDITSAWSTASNTFSIPRLVPGAVAYANNLYIFGGAIQYIDNFLSDVQYAKIDPTTGDLSTWSKSTSMPIQWGNGDAIATNGYVYLVGGLRNTPSASCTGYNTVLVAPISGNTSVSLGNNPTGIGNWYETNSGFAASISGGRYAARAVVNNGKIYTSGGACNNGASIITPHVQQSTLLTQPQVAKYSISFDTDTDVYPDKYLVNGLDNSVNARWQFKYRTMSNPLVDLAGNGLGKDCSAALMTDWGQETDVGDLSLGTLGTYTAKDGSGTDMKCGRYFFMSFSIDAQNTFGFPEDVSRGPTIEDISLRYTAQPAKRLMHGRTFIGGIQSPLDTPVYPN